MRATQTLGLAFLFVPTSTISYSTMPRALNSDASSLYVMLRNVAGSIGISLATAGITERTQTRQAYLCRQSERVQPGLQRVSFGDGQTLRGMGRSAGEAPARRWAWRCRRSTCKSAVLAYRDVFGYCAIGAFCVVPLVLLFEARTSRGASAGGGH